MTDEVFGQLMAGVVIWISVFPQNIFFGRIWRRSKRWYEDVSRDEAIRSTDQEFLEMKLGEAVFYRDHQ